MKLLIAGGTGFVGRYLCAKLKDQHDITILSRNISTIEIIYRKTFNACDWDHLESLNPNAFDAVINLCGKSIGDCRWTDENRQEIIDSRVKTTKRLVEWAKDSNLHLYCANAIGIYGAQAEDDDKAFTEDSYINFEEPVDYLSECGVLWQQAAVNNDIPTTIMRFGVVLKKGHGMLKKLYPSYYFGLGSVIGSGKQVISWIHIDDLVKAIDYLLNNPELTGVYNITAPNPVDQRTFAKTLSKTMNRPLLLTTPSFVIKSIFGEMGKYLITKGQRVIPKRLIGEGFEFDYPTIKLALQHEFEPN